MNIYSYIYTYIYMYILAQRLRRDCHSEANRLVPVQVERAVCVLVFFGLGELALRDEGPFCLKRVFNPVDHGVRVEG